MEKPTIRVKIQNGKLIKTKSNDGFELLWDGVYYNFYGEIKHYTHNKITYNCFPIITIPANLSGVVSIDMFGCEKNEGQFLCDGYLTFPIDYKIWKECVPFSKLKQVTYDY